MFVSVTRLRVRSLRYLLPFLFQTTRANRQVERSVGFLGGRLLADVHHTYWTLTVWESEKAMKSFRGSGVHAKVMPRLAKWCDEGAYAHWTIDVDPSLSASASAASTASIPTWPEAYEYLTREGKLSRVDHPSANHQARNFPQPRLKPLVGKDLKPAA